MKIFTLIAITAGASVGILVVSFFSYNTNNEDASSFLRHHRSRLGLVYDPRATVLKPPLEQLPKCQLRNLAAFKNGRVGRKYFDAVPKTLEGSNCLFFECTNDVNECDNGDPTNYDGPKPPCCTHVLRDMHRIFDDEMCSLGLDYFAAFGSLLGLRRADRFIPWSIDGDLIIHSAEAMNALVMLWDSKKTGLSHHYSRMNRMCVTPDFAGGGLMKWAYSEDRYRKAIDEWDRNWDLGFPYMDLYLGRYVEKGKLLELGAGGHKCLHYYKDVFPTQRKLVYNGQFTMNFPPNPDQLLRTNYGNGWRFPPSEKDKKEHGGRMCPYGPAQK
ncbi:hypothetical protein QTG54_002204 [Skeletonema marinoi]|uniref:Uncharacterized protein n=2 Tax=Skeletonema marinoi TaxID=267567 RepID=A0AAD8YK66_9STRA|nr:hypothetical protein QTG54_002204 [Skeletonema marinoi]